MSLEQALQKDLITAMKAKDQPTIRSIRAIKSEILLAKTDGSGKEVNEDAEIKILQRLIKQRQESADIYNKENRQDLAVVEEEEINVLMKYLPQQLDIEDVKANVKEIIQQVGAESMKDMGKVMGMANKQMAGKVDGKTLADVVKSELMG